MNFNNTSQIGLEKITLQSKPYANGNLYISAIFEKNKINSIDIRFYLEENNSIMPTKHGIRIPFDKIDTFISTFKINKDLLDEYVCWKKNKDSLIFRVLNNENNNYDVDIRFYRDSDNFKGWLKKGLRLTSLDYSLLGSKIRQIDFNASHTADNLFANKSLIKSKNLKLIGLKKLKLSQKRYEQGNFYISVLQEEDDVVSLDARYFIEEENNVTATKSGFRIPKDYLIHFIELINNDLVSLNENECCVVGDRKVLISYKDDRYGEAVDIRYYKESSEYTGWEKKGIRLAISDFIKIRDIINNTDFTISHSDNLNLFSSKHLNQSQNNNKSNKPKHKDSTYINEALMNILDL